MSNINEIFYNYCRDNKVDEAMKMIENGVKDYKGGFIGFCKSGNLEMIKFMISISDGDVDYDYGLRISSYIGNYDIVVYLLSVGAKDANGALFHACKGGQLEICNMLTKIHGAKIFNKAYVINIVKQLGHQNIVKFLISLYT